MEARAMALRDRVGWGLLLAVLLFVAVHSLDYCWGRFGVDHGVFASTGYHLAEGKRIYRDAWDHKPPGVLLTNQLAIEVGGPELASIRRVEIGFAVVLVFAFFAVVYAITGLALASGLFTLVLTSMFYHDVLNPTGNLTEEYAAACAVAAVALLVAHSRAGDGGSRMRGPSLLVAAGALFACATLYKEPFALSAIPWGLYVAARTKGRGLLPLATGFALPVLFVVAYLASQDALLAWIDVLSYNVGYTDRSGLSAFAKLASSAEQMGGILWSVHPVLLPLGALALASLADRTFLERHRYLPVAIVAWCAFDLLGASLAGKSHEHYYLQVVPSAVAVFVVGAAYAIHRLPEGSRARVAAVGLPLLLVLSFTARPERHAQYLTRLVAEPGEPRVTELSAYLSAHTEPGETVWVALAGSGASRTYYECQRLSPVRYTYLMSHLLIDTLETSAAEKVALIQRGLEENPPALIALDDRHFRENFWDERPELREAFAPLMAWIRERYEPRAAFGDVLVLAPLRVSRH